MNCRNLHILLLLMLTQGAVEFKSVKDVPPANFLEQFSKDLKNTDVSDLSQIKWIFDGKKVTQEQLTEVMSKIIESALELVGNTPLLRASRYAKKAGAEEANILAKLE